MRKMVFVTKLAATHLAKIQSAAPDWKIIQGRDPEIWLPHLHDAEIIGGWHRHIISTCLEDPTAKLRWIHNWGAGVNQLPFEKLQQRNIMVTNSSGVHAYPISETILAMMLTLTRRIHLYVRNQMVKKWDHANLSLEMHGKTVGILGVGAIGSETAKLCKAFGMRVLGLRRSGTPAANVDEMYDVNGLTALLANSDYVVNTLPLTEESYHLIGKSEFETMKPSAFYINIGRGNTTDEPALVEALQTGQIAGAGLDVFAQEPLAADSPLWEMENVVMTPHSSGSTAHYDERVIEIFLPNLETYLSGQEPTINRVNLELQY